MQSESTEAFAAAASLGLSPTRPQDVDSQSLGTVVERGSRARLATRIAACAVIALVTLAVFGRAMQFGFLEYDDNHYVTTNTQVQRGLSLETLRWAFHPDTFVAANWHPLTVVAHMVDVELFGLDPRGHHGMSILLHVLNALLLLLLLERMTGQLWPSALVAALFAWHPLHVESVAWVAERKDVLSTFFWLLTIAAYIHYAKWPSLWRYLLVVAGLIAGLLSKPMVVTLPATLLLLDVWPLGRFRSAPTRQHVPTTRLAADFTPPDGSVDTDSLTRRGAVLVAEKLPLLLIVALFCLTTLRAQQESAAVVTFDQVPMSFRLQNAAISYVAYLRQTFWPVNLAAIYPLDVNSVGPLRVAGAVALLLVISAVAILALRRRPYLFVGWSWFLGTLVPVIGLVQVGGQARADRYTYVPLIGIFVMIAFVAAELARRGKMWRVSISTLAVVWLVALAPLTWRQVGYWGDHVRLFQHALAVTGPNYLAHYHLANGLASRFTADDPLEGLSLDETLHLALRHYRTSLASAPKFSKGHYNLATAYWLADQPNKAVEHFARAIELGHDGPRIRVALAECFTKLEQHQQAYDQYATARRLQPTLRIAMIGMIHSAAQLDRVDLQVSTLRDWLQENPKDADALTELAWIYATSARREFREPQQALALARRAAERTDYKSALVLETLAAALAANGDFPAAIETASRTLAMVEQSEDNPKLQDQLRRRLTDQIARYQRRQPWRSTPAGRFP